MSINTRTKALVVVLGAVLVGVTALKFIAGPVFTIWLRAHSTVWMVQSPPGGRLWVAVHRLPRLGDVPECLGFGQGYVQLYEPGRGRVFQDERVEDLASIRTFAWGVSSVSISGVGEWALPKGYEYHSR